MQMKHFKLKWRDRKLLLMMIIIQKHFWDPINGFAPQTIRGIIVEKYWNTFDSDATCCFPLSNTSARLIDRNEIPKAASFGVFLYKNHTHTNNCWRITHEHDYNKKLQCFFTGEQTRPGLEALTSLLWRSIGLEWIETVQVFSHVSSFGHCMNWWE